MKIRTFAGISALALAAGASNAALIGGTLVENAASSAASSATVNGASRVYELMIIFNEADDILNSIGNASFQTSDGSTLIQTGVFGGTQDTDGDLNPGAWGFVPESQWDTYVAIGGPFPGDSNTSTDWHKIKKTLSTPATASTSAAASGASSLVSSSSRATAAPALAAASSRAPFSLTPSWASST